jgi:Helix-turn-helix domain
MSETNTNQPSNQGNLSCPGHDSELPRNVKGQRARILRPLLDAKGAWVPLPKILDLHISQFGARILELRRLGFQIENKTQRDDSGVVHSWYRLVNSPAAPTPDPISSFSAPKREEKERERPAGDTRHNRAGQFEREFKVRPGWQPRPFSEKRMADPDCFTLTPPEPRR